MGTASPLKASRTRTWYGSSPGLPSFVLEREAGVAEFDIAVGAALFAIGDVGEPFAAGGDVDDGRVDFVEADVVELEGVGGEGAGAEADVADADAAGRAIGVEVIEHDADAAVRGVIGGRHAAALGRDELRAVDRGAVQQDKFLVGGVFWSGFFDGEGAEEVAAFVDDAFAA